MTDRANRAPTGAPTVAALHWTPTGNGHRAEGLAGVYVTLATADTVTLYLLGRQSRDPLGQADCADEHEAREHAQRLETLVTHFISRHPDLISLAHRESRP